MDVLSELIEKYTSYEYELVELTLATGVGRICALRGWKSSKTPTTDDGLIVAYIKSGSVYYRNRCEQANQELVWEDERLVSDLPANCTDIALFRTNDYRVGFVAKDANNNIHWALTARTWAGFGIDESIDVRLRSLMTNFCPWLEPTGTAENPDLSDTHIVVTFDTVPIGYEDYEDSVLVTDNNNNTYAVHNTQQGTDEYKLVLTTASFASAAAPLTVSFPEWPDGSFGMQSGDCIMAPLDVVFYPTFETYQLEESIGVSLQSLSVDFLYITEYEAYLEESIGVSLEGLTVDFIEITEYFGYTEESIAVSLQNMTIDFIHIDDIEA